MKEFFDRNKKLLEKIYFTVIEWGTYLALFTPFIVSKYFFFPFVSPKTLFFRSVVNVIFLAYLLLVISNRKYLPKLNLLTGAVSVFILVLIFTSVSGVNLERSFWSTFERMTGLLTFFHLYAFFIVLTSVFTERKYWERIMSVSILVGILICLNIWTSNDPLSRGGGSLGNTSFLSAYLLFDIFFSLILLVSKKGLWKILYGFSTFLLLYMLFFPPQEPTIGAIGAFFIGLAILLVGFSSVYLWREKKDLAKIILPSFFLLAVVSGFFVFQSSFFRNKVDYFAQSNSWQSRAIVWRMGYESFKERAWFGWGLENFNIPFAKYYDPALPLTFDLWYDRVHNVAIDMMVQGGVVALFSYLAIFLISVLGLFKFSFKITEKRNLIFPFALIALLASYFLQNIWVFDMISSYVMFFLTLGLINFLLYGETNRTFPLLDRKPFVSFIGSALIIITLFTFYFGNVKVARAASFIVSGIGLPLNEAIMNFEKALKETPMALVEGAEQFSRKTTDSVYSNKEDAQILVKGLLGAEEALKKAILSSPDDYRFYLLLARQYNEMYQVTKDDNYLKEAERVFDISLTLSPKNQQTYWSLAQTHLYMGNSEKAIELLEAAISLEPKLGSSYWYLAMTYKVTGQYELAAKRGEEAGENGYKWKDSNGDLLSMAEIYQNLGDDQKLSEVLELLTAKNPQNAQYKAALAVAYANLNDFQKARELAEEAIRINPAFKTELEKFLSQLPR